jgi:hypothetical protein
VKQGFARRASFASLTSRLYGLRVRLPVHPEQEVSVSTEAVPRKDTVVGDLRLMPRESWDGEPTGTRQNDARRHLIARSSQPDRQRSSIASPPLS